MKHTTHENVSIQPGLNAHFLIYEDSNHLVNNHWHNSLEILLIKSGSMNIWVNDHLTTVNAGDFFLINSKDIHATKCMVPSMIQLLQIPYSFLKTNVSDMDNIRFDFDLIEDSQKKSETLFHIRSLLFSMGELYQRKEPAYTLKFTSLLYELLYLLVKDCQAQISSTKKAKNQMNHKRLTLIMDYVKEHYTEPISIKEASLLVSLNPEYFCRYFKKNMGITFLDYVNEVRMSHVYRDIMTTDLSITHILTLHGFTNYKLFLHMFREKYGCTPMQKRKQGTS